MAKDNLNLNVKIDQVNTPTNKTEAPKKNGKKTEQKEKPKFFQKIGKVCKEIISELKKVEWPKFKGTKNNPGVWANLGTVLVVVLFFLIIITAFDAGLTELLKLLTKM